MEKTPSLLSKESSQPTPGHFMPRPQAATLAPQPGSLTLLGLYLDQPGPQTEPLYPAGLALLTIYQQYLSYYEGQVGLLVASRTIQNIENRQAILHDFLLEQGRQLLPAADFSAAWGQRLLEWLTTTRQYRPSTAVKQVTSLTRVLGWAVERELIGANPLAEFEYPRPEAPALEYLTAAELRTLSSRPLSARLGRVRDCFVFQCWTGLSYDDLSKLNVAQQQERYRARRLVQVRRSKSTMYPGYTCKVPLLAEAERILARHGDALPVPTNQIYNRYLKQVAETCGLGGKSLTAQVGRNTGGMMLLSAGAPVELVSRILGHSSPRKTQRAYGHYADAATSSLFQKKLREEYGLEVRAVGSKVSRQMMREQLAKLQIRFHFVADVVRKPGLHLAPLRADQPGALRVTISVAGRDTVRIRSLIRTTRSRWSTDQQQGVPPNGDELTRQASALRSKFTRLFLDLIERKQALTAGALIRAYQSRAD